MSSEQQYQTESGHQYDTAGSDGYCNHLRSSSRAGDDGGPFNRRRLNLGATPVDGTLITAMDLDLTVACNLRCTYCFKEKWNEHMEEQVAFDALIWLLYASGPAADLTVNFMGGEPLMRFNLIKRIVPFGKRRAWQMGKTMHFGATTNATLVTDKVVAFWRCWGMGFHTSIDGPPEIQDRNRPMASGRGSAWRVETAARKILAYRPQTVARCTVVPASVSSVAESCKYFLSLGYRDIVFCLFRNVLGVFHWAKWWLFSPKCLKSLCLLHRKHVSAVYSRVSVSEIIDAKSGFPDHGK